MTCAPNFAVRNADFCHAAQRFVLALCRQQRTTSLQDKRIGKPDGLQGICDLLTQQLYDQL